MSAEEFAALDLGSNSFHMVVARKYQGEVSVLDKMRERVQLGAGLGDDGCLTEAAQARALASLARFGERIRSLPPGHVRVVGTNALRRAKNRTAFLEKASQVLGRRIDIVSGQEEARLIYVGVDQSNPPFSGRRFVVDIGGGSTEVILGSGPDVLLAHSHFMGCVRFAARFFPDGVIDRERLTRAEIAAELELQSTADKYRALGWGEALGCSGTIEAVSIIVQQSGLSDGTLSEQVLDKLRRRILKAKHVDNLTLPGLKPERKGVFPSGFAILMALFRTFDLDGMRVSSGAMREGILYDLLGRVVQHRDVRVRTIRAFEQRYGVDAASTRPVVDTALGFLGAVADRWGLEGQWPTQVLTWAARLSRIGISIAYTGYHKHSAYIVKHADMPGFSRQEQDLLAAILLSHRRRLRHAAFADLDEGAAELALRLCVLLRLARTFHRSYPRAELPEISLKVASGGLRLGVPAAWLSAHPLTRADLQKQQEMLAVVGFGLEINEVAPAK